MANKLERVGARNEMERFFDVVESETGVSLYGDRKDLKRHFKSDWKHIDNSELQLIVELWKENIIFSKSYITGKLARYLLSEIRRGEI